RNVGFCFLIGRAGSVLQRPCQSFAYQQARCGGLHNVRPNLPLLYLMAHAKTTVTKQINEARHSMRALVYSLDRDPCKWRRGAQARPTETILDVGMSFGQIQRTKLCE